MLLVAGIMVIIARFQWVGVMSITESTCQSDDSTAADADVVVELATSPRMQYFIQVVLYSAFYLGIHGYRT